MSDKNPARRSEHTLLGTDDAMVWAQEFCRIFAGATIVQNAAANPNFSGTQVDEGTMVGWFANAMQTALDLQGAGVMAIVMEFEEDIEEEDEELPSLEEEFKAGFDEGRAEGRATPEG